MDKITIGLREYMDRLLSSVRLEFDLKISALKEEYKKSEKQIGEAKAEVDAHFAAVNSLQARMDKMSQTFMTSRDVDEKVKLAVANLNGNICNLGLQIKVMWGLIIALILLFVEEYIRG